MTENAFFLVEIKKPKKKQKDSWARFAMGSSSELCPSINTNVTFQLENEGEGGGEGAKLMPPKQAKNTKPAKEQKEPLADFFPLPHAVRNYSTAVIPINHCCLGYVNDKSSCLRPISLKNNFYYHTDKVVGR